MKHNKIKSIGLGGLSIFLFLVAMVACSTGFFTYRGLVIDEDKLIRLENGGPHDGTWGTDDLALMYRYTRTGDKLMISGEIHFNDRLKNSGTHVDNFDLWIHLINSENKIEGERNLSPYSYYFEINKIPFDETIVLSAGIKAISFSYSGRVSEGGSNSDDKDAGGISVDFWKVPNG